MVDGAGKVLAHLGNIGILESSLKGDRIPVDIGLVSGVLDDTEEEHGLSGSGFLLCVGHDVRSMSGLVYKVSPNDHQRPNENKGDKTHV